MQKAGGVRQKIFSEVLGCTVFQTGSKASTKRLSLITDYFSVPSFRRGSFFNSASRFGQCASFMP